MEGVLDETLPSGPVPVVRELVAGRAIRHLPHSVGDARDAISDVLQVWGGASHLLMCGTDGEVATLWRSLAVDADVDNEIAHRGADNPHWSSVRAWPRSLASLLAVAAGFRTPKRDLKPLHVTTLDIDDPWLISYLGHFGWLNEDPDESLLAGTYLPPGTAFDDIFNVEREAAVGDPVDLIGRISSRRGLTPIQMSRVLLRSPEVSYRMFVDQIWPPLKDPEWHRFGPGIVVVYEPGSVADLCLLWNLRADRGFPLGSPIAIPLGAVEEALPVMLASHVLRGGFGSPTFGLTSLSVDAPTLRSIATSAGKHWEYVHPSAILRSGHRLLRASREVANYVDGVAAVPTWSPPDETELPDDSALHLDLGLRCRVRPSTMRLPPVRSLSGEPFGVTYRFGSCEVDGARSEVTDVSWPAGWTVLQAAARDHGLEVRRSVPGMAAEAFLVQLGELHRIAGIANEDCVSVLTRLCEDSGMSWFRARFRELTSGMEDRPDRLAVLESKVDAVARSAEVSPRSITSNQLAGFLHSKEELTSWVRWAEASGILVRGVQFDCGLCGHKQWSVIAQIAPPIVCRGCGREVPSAFPPDHLVFRYRASTALSNVFRHDSLSHLLTARWLGESFGPSFGSPGYSYGVHPGVEFVDSNGSVIGEVDVVMLTTEGEFVLAECKRSAAGLNDEEVFKLGVLAERLNSPWLVISTLSSANEAKSFDQWRSPSSKLGRPVVTAFAEHLYSSLPATQSLGAGSLPDAHHRIRVGEVVAWWSRSGQPDWQIRESWH